MVFDHHKSGQIIDLITNSSTFIEAAYFHRIR